MSFLVLRDFDPLIVVHRHAPTHVVGMAAMLGTVDRFLAEAIEQERKLALVYDTTERATVRGAARRMASEWLRDPHELLARGATSIDFVVTSPLARSAAKAILWMRNPPVPGEMHRTRARAVASAVSRLREGGFEPHPAIAEHGDAAITARIARLLLRA